MQALKSMCKSRLTAKVIALWGQGCSQPDPTHVGRLTDLKKSLAGLLSFIPKLNGCHLSYWRANHVTHACVCDQPDVPASPDCLCLFSPAVRGTAGRWTRVRNVRPWPPQETATDISHRLNTARGGLWDPKQSGREVLTVALWPKKRGSSKKLNAGYGPS